MEVGSEADIKDDEEADEDVNNLTAWKIRRARGFQGEGGREVRGCLKRK